MQPKAFFQLSRLRPYEGLCLTAKDLQDEQQRDKMFADSLQSRINALTTDFVNRDDPYQRAQIGKDRDAAVKELDRVKKAIVDRTKAIGDLEEEARRAGAPAGWLR